MKLLLAIPTYNGGELWRQSATSIKQQLPAGTDVHVVDSDSKDATQQIALSSGFKLSTISAGDFNHGRTRNEALANAGDRYDVVIFLTQDAIPEKDCFEKIAEVFTDERIACAYGRQLAHIDANPIARHARMFNYPQKPHIYDLKDVPQKGMKTVFMSNSFSAYRVKIFEDLGGFPSNTILCEDMFITAKAVESGYKVAYVAEAKVRHSHNYSPLEEFKRYFDIGVFHCDEPWIRKKFGGASGEGFKFVTSELRYLISRNIFYVPLTIINTASKLAGYKLGLVYKKLPRFIVKACSMHKRYWK